MCLACIQYQKDKSLGNLVSNLARLLMTQEISEDHSQDAFEAAVADDEDPKDAA